MRLVSVSVVTKAVYLEAEAPGFKAEAVASETEAEAARQYVNKSHVNIKISFMCMTMSIVNLNVILT